MLAERRRHADANGDGARLMSAPLLAIQDLVVSYRLGMGRSLRAVNGVSLAIEAGHTLAVIGESGSGKSTIARAICGLGPVESGTITVAGGAVTGTPDRAVAAGRLGVQIVFQDPNAALDPRWPVWRSIAEPRGPLFPPAPDRHRGHAIALLERVGLNRAMADRRASELSGGQRQRVTIARALAAEPRLVILPVSALDVSVRNEILVLLDELKRADGLTYLLISHDMGAVIQIATDVAVMYLGEVVEQGPAPTVLGAPRHPYTLALLAAVPTLDGQAGKKLRLTGEIGDPARPPPGCRFHPRCPLAIGQCRQEPPRPRSVAGRQVACHRAEETDAAQAA